MLGLGEPPSQRVRRTLDPHTPRHLPPPSHHAPLPAHPRCRYVRYPGCEVPKGRLGQSPAIDSRGRLAVWMQPNTTQTLEIQNVIL